MVERFTVYRYEVRRPPTDQAPSDDARPGAAGGAPKVEARWTFVPVRAAGYGGDDLPVGAQPSDRTDPEVGSPVRYGEIEAPEGSRVVSLRPPILEVPGRGQVALLAVMGIGAGETQGGPPAQEVSFRRA